MKKLIPTICIILLGVCSSCTFLKENPQFTRSILEIGLKYAVMTLVNDNPNVEPHVRVIARVLENPVDILSPDSLQRELDKAIERNIQDLPNQTLVKDLAEQVLTFYSSVYEAHKDTLDQATYTEIIKSMGATIRLGLTPEIPAHDKTVFETPTHMILIY